MKLQPNALGGRGNQLYAYLSPEYLILILTGSSSSPDICSLEGFDHLSNERLATKLQPAIDHALQQSELS